MKGVRIAYAAAEEIDRLDDQLIQRKGLPAAELRREQLRAVLMQLSRGGEGAEPARLSPPGRPLNEIPVDPGLTLVIEFEPGGLRVIHAYAPA